MRIRTTLIALALLALPLVAAADVSFTPGHYYTSSYSSRDIREYDADGNLLGSITLPGSTADEIRGLAFGPDGLLYATAVRGSGFAVLALDNTGIVHQAYPGDVYVNGNISYGKIALDNDSIYVTGQNQLIKFTRGDPDSGQSIYTNNQVFDVEVLPSGNLLAASAYYVEEITNDGALVRQFTTQPSFLFTDIRGIEYNPRTNKLFVTHLGHTDFFFRIMRFDATTGVLEDDESFNYADDLFLTDAGELLVGSRTQVPRIYNQELDQVGMLGNDSRMFVTQLRAVPEPAGSTLFASAALVTIWTGSRRRTRWPLAVTSQTRSARRPPWRAPPGSRPARRS